jgi:branched-chain amino acid transport system permease protein
MDIFLQQIVNGVVLGSVYALIALGYTMVYGILQLINFAHGDVLMIGALTGLTAIRVLQSVMPDAPGWLMLLVAIAAAVPTCVILNVTIERLAYRPLRNAPRLAPLITAIGLSIVIQTAAMLIFGRNPQQVPRMTSAEPFMFPVGDGEVVITAIQVLIIALAVSLMAALVILVEKTKLGRAMRATAENPKVAGLMGVDSNRVIVATFAIGAALAAVAGVLVASNYGQAHYSMGFMPGLKAFIAAVLGGIGNIYGAMVGGLVLGLVESLGAGYIGDLTGEVLGSNYQDIFAFVVLIVVLVFKPSGIMGERVADRA